VSIEPPVPNKKINRQVISKLRETFGQLEFQGKLGAYDGEKSLFTSGSLNFNSKEFKVYLEDQRGPSFRPGDRVRSVDSPPPDSPPDIAGTNCFFQHSSPLLQ
jgi:eukaryotic translation initiation factor 2C